MHMSGRYTKQGHAPRWLCVDVEPQMGDVTMEAAARRALPVAADGWRLDGIASGDQAQGSAAPPVKAQYRPRKSPSKRRRPG